MLPFSPNKCNCRCLTLLALRKTFGALRFRALFSRSKPHFHFSKPYFHIPSLAFTFSSVAFTFSSLAFTVPNLAIMFPSLVLTYSSFTVPSLALIYLTLPSKLDSCSFEPCTFKISRLWASLSRLYHFEPHPVSSLHSFDLILIIPGLRFRNTCPISVMSMQHVSKQTSRQTYKDNICGIKLSCRTIEIRAR